jgi:23S rRNA pseudouridine1911/1915/1917 synthase
MHQVRIQAASRGWPVLGDAQYGSQTAFGPPYDDPRRGAIALHARQLSFLLPGPTRRTFVAPVAQSWRDLGIADELPTT